MNVIKKEGYHWYAVSTLSGREEKAKHDITNSLSKAAIADACKQIVIPKETVVSEDAQGARKERQHTVMPGYVFLLMDARRAAHVVVTTPGVFGFVQGSDHPVPLSDQEVERFLGKEGHSKHHVEIINNFQPDDLVRIVTGPMADFTGLVESVNEHKKTLRVVIEIFGQETPTEVSLDSVRKA